MEADLSRVAVLLGAGASYEAGLPLSSGLTDLIAADLGQDKNSADRRLSDAFNKVCSAIIGHRGGRGERYTDALNIERVLSSIRLLSEREDHEAAPFVANWLPSLTSDSGQVPTGLARKIRDEVKSTRGPAAFPHALAGALTTAIQAVVGGNDATLWADLERKATDAVAARLSRLDDVSYLTPLTDLAEHQGGLDIATLNYDLAVETLCATNDTSITRGLDDWWPHSPLSWGGSGIRLYKLHGSVDWWRAPRNSSDRDTHGHYLGEDRIYVGDSPANYQARRAIVLGDRGKLESQPITLALMATFAAALEDADRLVIVGYSYSDDHINRIIADWLDADRDRTITGLGLESDFTAPNQAFAKRLVRLPYDGATSPIPRFNAVTVTRGTSMRPRLAHALAQPPVADDELSLACQTSWDTEDSHWNVTVTNNTGEALIDLTASAHPTAEESPRTEVYAGIEYPPDYQKIIFPRGVRLENDSSLSFRVVPTEFPSPGTPAPHTLRLSMTPLVGFAERRLSLV